MLLLLLLLLLLRRRRRRRRRWLLQRLDQLLPLDGARVGEADHARVQRLERRRRLAVEGVGLRDLARHLGVRAHRGVQRAEVGMPLLEASLLHACAREGVVGGAQRLDQLLLLLDGADELLLKRAVRLQGLGEDSLARLVAAALAALAPRAHERPRDVLPARGGARGRHDGVARVRARVEALE